MSHQSDPRLSPSNLTNKIIINKAGALIRNFGATRYSSKEEIKEFLNINFDIIYEEYIYPEYEISIEEDCDLGHDAFGKKVLAKTVVRSGKLYVLIDRCLHHRMNDARRVFTCWHEIGHAILHGDWLKEQLLGGPQDTHLVTTEASINTHVGMIDVLEQQANLFASHAAAPGWFVRMVLEHKFSLERPFRYTGPGTYSLVMGGRTYNRKCESLADLCKCISYLIQYRFGGLSIEALSYRVRVSGLIDDFSEERLCRYASKAKHPTSSASKGISNRPRHVKDILPSLSLRRQSS